MWVQVQECMSMFKIGFKLKSTISLASNPYDIMLQVFIICLKASVITVFIKWQNIIESNQSFQINILMLAFVPVTILSSFSHKEHVRKCMCHLNEECSPETQNDHLVYSWWHYLKLLVPLEGIILLEKVHDMGQILRVSPILVLSLCRQNCDQLASCCS